MTMTGQKLPLKCSVDYISFSAHTDYKQTSEFLRALKPAHVVSHQLGLTLTKNNKSPMGPNSNQEEIRNTNNKEKNVKVVDYSIYFDYLL